MKLAAAIRISSRIRFSVADHAREIAKERSCGRQYPHGSRGRSCYRMKWDELPKLSLREWKAIYTLVANSL